MSVTIVTITQFSRIKNFTYLKDQILNQVYKPMTWIIVNGSKTDDDAILLKEFLNTQNINTIVENYIYISRTDRNFAEMHNVAFSHCVTDYVALMEDDEYYQPTYLENYINELSKSDILIAGCSKLYLWHEKKQQMYKWICNISNGHATNATLVFKTEYLLNHYYGGNNFSIENTFLEKFKVPMIQMDAQQSVIHVFHENNTNHWKRRIVDWIQKNIIEKVSNNETEKFTEILQKMEF